MKIEAFLKLLPAVQIGGFRDGLWRLDRCVRRTTGLYLWVQSETREIIRLGISGDVYGRHGTHNSHIRGTHGRDRPRVMRVAALTLQYLQEGDEVWMVPIARSMAAELEPELRNAMGASLALDLSAPGSWLWLQMRR